MNQSISRNPSPFAFTVQPRDANGLRYLRARYYHPHLANWGRLGPLETNNRYSYAHATPGNFVDLSGLDYTPPIPDNLGGGCLPLQLPCTPPPPKVLPGNVRLTVAGCPSSNWDTSFDGGTRQSVVEQALNAVSMKGVLNAF